MILRKLLFMLLISSATYAQTEKDQYFSLAYGIDARNALVGSKPTNDEPALNWTIEGHAVAENYDFSVGYEQFDAIKYDRLFVGFGHHIHVAYLTGTKVRFSIQPSLEWSNISRGYTQTAIIDGVQKSVDAVGNFNTLGINVNWNWDLTKHFGVQIASNWIRRNDVRIIYNQKNDKYVLSQGVKLVYRF